MRDILREFEERVARLEKQAGFLDLFTGKVSLKKVEEILSHSGAASQVQVLGVRASSPDRIELTLRSTDKFHDPKRQYHFLGEIVQNADRVKAASAAHAMMSQRPSSSSGGSYKAKKNDIIVAFTPDYRKLGITERDYYAAKSELRLPNIEQTTICEIDPDKGYAGFDHALPLIIRVINKTLS